MAEDVKAPEGNEQPVVCQEQKCCGGKNLEGVQQSDKAKSLKDDVAQAIAGCGPQVYANVKETLVQEEVKSRTDLVLKALKKRAELEQEIRKVQPDKGTAGYDHTGKVVKEAVYTKQQVEELKKLREQLNKVERAIDKALDPEKPCFDKLKEVVGK